MYTQNLVFLGGNTVAELTARFAVFLSSRLSGVLGGVVGTYSSRTNPVFRLLIDSD
ncbi:hypothetical protein SAMN05421752_107149 [Natronorubrum thiooxidans]|uniref:Uncharacterized protein n=1 Tax=Natronorubrum thiooxidans TaxID=308853 RepID=A0A1N7FMJ0_9EURY|nr:hypothetical protein SAMN05421752_107149 [Natronorubrum thiooxidans]